MKHITFDILKRTPCMIGDKITFADKFTIVDKKSIVD